MPHIELSTPLIALDAVALDTETTGLDSATARIVEIGAVRITRGEVGAGKRFETLVNPGIAIPKEAIAVHRITDDRVAAAPRFADIAGDLEAFIGRSVLIGHATAYDLAVLRREYALAGRAWPDYRALDVRALASCVAPPLPDHGLDRLCAWLGIEITRRHSALGDAEAAAELFAALVPLLRTKNIRTLAEAEAAQRAHAERDALEKGTMPTTETGATDATRALARIDSFPYRHRVRDLMSAPPLFAPAETTIAAAVHLLLEKRVSSVFVRLRDGGIGIVTERDLLRAIDGGGAATLHQPIEPHVKAPLETVAADDFLYRAIGRIERLGFRHLGVRDRAGDIVGAVTTRNLLRHRATTAIALGDEIDAAPSAAALGLAWSKLPAVARNLMAEEVDPRMAAAVISTEICAMTRRAAELAEERMRADGLGAPPCAYDVLVLGSAGRGESQLAADQDNAIVYAEGVEGGPEDGWFATLGGHIADTLDAAGVPYCKGGVMARNRPWRQSVADWRHTIDGWVRRQRPEDLLSVDIFFDAVAVHGQDSLGEAIWNHAYERGHAAPDFQSLLIENARQRGNPFTLFGGFRIDHRERIDLKKFGLMPIFTAARVLSIRHDVRARSTADRLNGVAAKGIGSPEIIGGILDAQRVILGEVIAQQLIDTDAGVPLTPRVAPARLDRPRRAALKQALAAVNEAVGLVGEGRV